MNEMTGGRMTSMLYNLDISVTYLKKTRIYIFMSMGHYDEKYFNYQKKIGKVGGFLNKFKFQEHIKSNDTLLDFGCGGGYLLSEFSNENKIGFEINKSAQKQCELNNIRVEDDFNRIEDNSIDTIISNHAMEHVPLPLESLQNLHKKLKLGGTLVIVIPCEQPHEGCFKYKENDINKHLHSWCPMTFGNLVSLAGFKVISCDVIVHKWCSDYLENYNKPDFHERCIKNAKDSRNIQIKLVATKI